MAGQPGSALRTLTAARQPAFSRARKSSRVEPAGGPARPRALQANRGEKLMLRHRLLLMATLAGVVVSSLAGLGDSGTAGASELPGQWQAPPGDPLEHTAAGYAKILCSAVFISGRT